MIVIWGHFFPFLFLWGCFLLCHLGLLAAWLAVPAKSPGSSRCPLCNQLQIMWLNRGVLYVIICWLGQSSGYLHLPWNKDNDNEAQSVTFSLSSPQQVFIQECDPCSNCSHASTPRALASAPLGLLLPLHSRVLLWTAPVLLLTPPMTVISNHVTSAPPANSQAPWAQPPCPPHPHSLERPLPGAQETLGQSSRSLFGGSPQPEWTQL